MTAQVKKLFQSIKKLQFIINYLGHINAAIGLGQAAAKRGHKVSYLLNEAFKGEAFNFTNNNKID